MPKTSTGARWKSVLSFRVSDETKKEFMAHSKEEKETMSEALRDYLEQLMRGWKK